MNRVFAFLILAICFEAGCQEQPTPPPRGITILSDKKNDEEIIPKKVDQVPQSDVTKDKAEKKLAMETWLYKTKQGFQFSLPKGWKQKPGKDEFYWVGFGSPMVSGVRLVRKESLEQFRKTAQDYWDVTRKSPDQVKEPTREQGKTKSGDPFSFVIIYEKGQKSDTYYYFACSHTWLKHKELTVQMIFEGQGKMQSRAFKAREHAAFENAARAICLSVEEIAPE